MAFFEFSQNNSGGTFDLDVDAGVTNFIIIEAESAEKAANKFNEITDSYGATRDCPCCGPRWDYYIDDDDAEDEPKLYGKPVKEYLSSGRSILWMEKGREVCVHYNDGRRDWY